MKKIFAALILCLALCVVACFALAEGGEDTFSLKIQTEGGYQNLSDGGTLSGQFYYKIYVEDLPEGCHTLQLGWGETGSTSYEGEWEGRDLDHDDYGDYLFIIPWLEGEYNSEVMFARVNEEDTSRYINLEYNRFSFLDDSKKPVISNNVAPILCQRDYTVEWSAVSYTENEQTIETEFYQILWDAPGDEEDQVYWSHEPELNLEDRDRVWGNPTNTIGEYRVRIFAFANGRLLEVSDAWEFEIGIPEASLELTPWQDEWIDPQEGYVGMSLYQWVNLNAFAPCADEILLYVTDSADGPDNFDSTGPRDFGWVNEEGYWGFSWVPDEGDVPEGTVYPGADGDPVTFDKWLFVRARYGGNEEGEEPTWKESNRIKFTVTLGEPIAAAPVWAELTSEECTVPQDGLFCLKVQNTEDPVYGYGMTAFKNSPEEPAADSMWVPREAGEFTNVYMPLITAEPGEYTVQVYTVKFGARKVFSPQPFTITVEEPVNSKDILFCMKDEFQANERLRVCAQYRGENHEFGCMKVEILNDSDEVMWEDYSGDYFWNEWWSLDNTGNYRIVATVYAKDENNPDPLCVAEFPITVTAEYQIEIDDPIDLPIYVEDKENNGFTFTVYKPKNAEGYNISVWCYDPDIDKETVLYDENDLTDNSTEVGIVSENIPHANPMSPKYISVHIHAYSGERNVGSSDRHWEIPLVPMSPDDTKTVTLEKTAPAGNAVQVNEEVAFRVTASDGDGEIKEFCLFDGNSYGDHFGPDEEGCCEQTLSFGEANRTHPVFALVTFEDWNDEYHEIGDRRVWYTTNVIKITTDDAEQAGKFSFTMDREPEQDGSLTLTRGEDILITYQAAEHATHYWIDGEWWNEEGHFWEWAFHDADLFLDSAVSEGEVGTALLRTGNLNREGRYRFFAGADSVGYIRSYGYYGDDVKPTQMNLTDSDEPTWYVRGTDENHEMWTHDPLTFSVYVSGAHYIEVAIENHIEEDYWEESWRGDNGGGSSSFRCDEWTMDSPAELRLKVYANTDDDDEFEVVEEYSHHIVIRAEESRLPLPEITLDSKFVVAGNPILFSFAENDDLFEDEDHNVRKAEYADVWYNAYLWSANGDPLDELKFVEPGCSLSFDTGNLNPDSVYRVSVDIQQRKYTGAATEAQLLLISSAPDTEHTVTLLVDEAYINTQPNVEIPFTVSAPGAKVIRIYNGDEWQEWWTGMPDTFTRSRSFNSGEKALVICASWAEDEPVWAYSNVVCLHVYGEWLPNPVLTLGGLNESGEIARGEELAVNVSEGDMTDIEAVRDYYLHVMKQGEDNEFINYFFRSYEMNEEGAITLTFSTSGLPEGDYMVQVDGNAAGYDWASDWKEFKVTQGSEPAEGVHIFAEPVSTINGHSVMVSAYAPGATCLRIYEENQNSDGEDMQWVEKNGGTLITSYSDNHPNTHKLYAMAWFGDNDPGTVGGTRSEETVEISFASEEGCRLENPQVIFNGVLTGDEPFVLEMSAVEHATEYSLIIWDQYIRDGGYDRNIYNCNSTGPISVTLPRSMFVTGHEYGIDVNVSAPCFESSDRVYNLYVIEPEDGFSMTVNGSTEPEEIPVNERFSVYAKAPDGATCIAVLHPDGWWDFRGGDTFEEYGWSCGEDRQDVVMFARYTMNDVPEQGSDGWNEFDFESVTWKYSEPVTVTFTAVGRVPDFEVDVTPADSSGNAIVTQGEFITVKITNVGAVVDGIREQLEAQEEVFIDSYLNFNARIVREEDGLQLTPDWYNWNGIDEIAIPTAEVTFGNNEKSINARLEINAGYENGWIGSGIQVPVTVTAGNEEAYFRVSKAEVKTSENFVFALYVPGARGVRICEIWDGENQEIDSWEADTRIRTYNYGNPGIYTLHAQARNEQGDWDDVEGLENIVVTVNAEEGNLNASVTVPVRIESDDGLRISWDTGDIIPDNVDIQICRTDGWRVWHSWQNGRNNRITIPNTMPQQNGNSNFEQMGMNAGDPVFEAGTIYCVQIGFQKLGWQADYKEVYFAVDDTEEIRTLVLPTGLETIESEAFAGVSANRVEIGESVTEIQEGAFADITGVFYVDFTDSNQVQIDGNAFANTNVLILCGEGSNAWNFARDYSIPYSLK